MILLSGEIILGRVAEKYYFNSFNAKLLFKKRLNYFACKLCLCIHNSYPRQFKQVTLLKGHDHIELSKEFIFTDYIKHQIYQDIFQTVFLIEIILSEYINFNSNSLFRSDCETFITEAEIEHANCMSSCRNVITRTSNDNTRAIWGRRAHIFLKRIWKCKYEISISDFRHKDTFIALTAHVVKENEKHRAM